MKRRKTKTGDKTRERKTGDNRDWEEGKGATIWSYEKDRKVRLR